MATASVEGFTKGFLERPYPDSADGVAALSSFYFGFGVGGAPDDHPLLAIGVLPGGPSQDLTPGADLSPSDFPAGSIALQYADKNGDDRYFYRASHAMLSSGAQRFQLRDVGSVGSERIRLPQSLIRPQQPGFTPDTLALAGFHMFFTGGREHKLDQLGVLLGDDNELFVAYNDKNDDDTFGFLIDLVRIPGTPLTEPGVTQSRATGGGVRGGDRRFVLLPANTQRVLRGFMFDFGGDSEDNNLREVGVLLSGDRIDVFYGDLDPNSDPLDRMSWEVRWTDVPLPSRVGGELPVGETATR